MLAKYLNKNIADIQYNTLNLPSPLTFDNRNSVKCVYNANEVKLRTLRNLNGDTGITDYCGNAVYENGALKMLLNEVGYISLLDKVFHFYLKDHLGDVRVVADEDGHGLRYVQTKDRYSSAHHSVEGKETNIPLRKAILNSRRETLKNMSRP
ncbi:MAG: hypothetical protein ACK5LF_21515 [Bacteroides xylanisolvens]